MDANNLSLSRALADFDIRQKMSLSLLYETPRLRGRRVADFLSRWQLGTVTILQSGRPFSVTCGLPFSPIRDASGTITGNSGCDYNADGFNTDYPNAPSFGGYLSGIDRSKYLTGIFQASDFGKPAPGRPGTLGRNTYFGPGFAITNFNVVKRFPLPMLGEAGQLDFRSEFFNLFNRVNLGQPNGSLTSSQFGMSTTALVGPQRAIRLQAGVLKPGGGVLTAIGLVLSVVPAADRPAAAFQGMAMPNAPRPAGPSVRTTLPPIAVDFRDIAPAAGMIAANVSGASDNKQYILETTGSGVAIFDYDDDGLMDVFLVNGTTLDGTGKPSSHLYRNLGNLRFEDVTKAAGLTYTGWGQGVCAGDYDNDGRRDLFVTYYGHSRLYRNRGDGKFEDVTRRAGLESAAIRWDAGCSFVDYDLDGKLDLVVTGYVDFDVAKVPKPGSGGFCMWKGMPVMCGPRGLPAGRNYLFHNDGDGRFRDVSEASGVGAPTGCYGFTAVASDFDDDGYPDLFVACDSTPSLLYHNQKNGTFEEIGVAAELP